MALIRYDPVGTVVATTETLSIKNDTEWSIGDDPVTIDQLHVGFTQEWYRSLFELVDFRSSSTFWDPAETKERYELLSFENDDYSFVVSPIPRIPEEYDPNYEPLFFVVKSTGNSEVYAGVDRLNDEVEDHQLDILYFALITGGCGWLVTCIIVCW